MSAPIQKITFAEMRESGIRGLLVYCADYRCSHSIAVNADQWPDDLRMSDIDHRFVSEAYGKRGADVLEAYVAHFNNGFAPASNWRGSYMAVGHWVAQFGLFALQPLFGPEAGP